MEKNKTKWLKLQYWIILLGFFILMAQSFFHFAKEWKLKGAIVYKPDIEFTFDKWFSGEYQKAKDAYIEEHIGFRNFFIRLKNQISFSLFKHAKANGAVIGKENYLYEEGYLNAHLGRDFIGEDAIKEKLRKLQFVSDKLKLRYIDLVFVLAPGKGSFFPEYFPESFNPEQDTTTNYEVFSRELRGMRINYIDFHKWFRENKSTSTYPLFPKNGIHWSRYGEVVAADSLLRYIEQLRNINIPNVVIDTVIVSSKMKYTDQDIEDGMNIFQELEDFEMGYPEYHKSEAKGRVKGLVMSDSYFWGLYGSRFSLDYLDNGQFWYYNEQIHQDGKEARNVSEVDVKEEVQQHQVVIILLTDMNLYRFAFGFVDKLYEVYDIPYEMEYQERLARMEDIIRNDPNWFESIKQKSLNKGNTIEEELTANAKYMLWREDTP